MTPIQPWREHEIVLEAEEFEGDPYLDVEAWIDFEHECGTALRRPAFWDGGGTWRVRFASPLRDGIWRWRSGGNVTALDGREGTLEVVPGETVGRFEAHGFWHIPEGGRNLLHRDGTPALLVADTAWALPWRATLEDCEAYAKRRAEQGFNAALLMTLQPDRRAEGPEDREADGGFARAFDDLPTGTLRRLRPQYFREFDRLVGVLVAHGIVPVYQPVFHGFGWKGLGTAGNDVSPEDYARYCRYLVARYGARPAIYLVLGDGDGESEAVRRGGEEIERSDAYGQPTGLHYGPHGTNRSFQEAGWVDFQWCQTGHNGEHLPERTADLWRNEPVKAVANGEPTYERIGRPDRAVGWWQGHEAWCNLCAGGTMGVVYGAGSLWQWKLHRDEPGHPEWAMAAKADWRDALEFEGANYVGHVGRILAGMEFDGMAPTWSFTYGGRALAVSGKFFLIYLERGGDCTIRSEAVPRSYRIFDPRTGVVVATGELGAERPAPVSTGSEDARVIVFGAPRSGG